MKISRRLAAVLLCLLVAATAAAAERRELVGKVFHLGENGEEILESGVAVRMESSGAATLSNDHGIFRLPLPEILRSGDVVQLGIGKKGWRIRYPLEGEVRIPAEPQLHIEKVELLPAGSKLFWTNDRIEKFVANEIRKTTLQLVDKKEDPQLRFSRAVREWAERYGLAAETAKSEIDRWIAEVKQSSSSGERQLGLAAYAEQQFEKAAKHFNLAAEEWVAELSQIDDAENALEERRKKARESAALNYLDQARSHFYGQRYEAARLFCLTGLQYASPEENPENWAFLQRLLGATLGKLASSSDVKTANRLIAESISANVTCLRVFSREAWPQEWGTAQMALGTEYSLLFRNSAGEEANRFFEQAMSAYHNAAEIATRDSNMKLLAQTQGNLGVIFYERSSRSEGVESAQMLELAVRTYRSALQLQRQGALARDWGAWIETNLAISLISQGVARRGADLARLLDEAASTVRSALEVYRHDRLPLDRAFAQEILGWVLLEQGRAGHGENSLGLLSEAMSALENALTVYTPDFLPLQWASSQAFRGGILVEQGKRSEGVESERLLADAASTFQRTLRFRTRELSPVEWAWTQDGLGQVLVEQAIRASGNEATSLLAESVAAFRGALEVTTREYLPQEWAAVETHLGAALREQGTRSQGEEATRLWEEALGAERQALQVLTREHIPGGWIKARREEGLTLQAMGRSAEAAQAFAEVLEVEPEQPEIAQRLAELRNVGGESVSIATAFLGSDPDR